MGDLLMPRALLYAALAALYVLHEDGLVRALWPGDLPERLLGLPLGLAYHLAYCLAAAGLMAALVRWAWPKDAR